MPAHEETTFLLQMLLIFVTAKGMGEICRRISLPDVLGEVAAGVVFGPSLLALVRPTESIGSIAELGAIFLLFTAGLEMHPEELIKTGARALGVAALGIVASFVLEFLYLNLNSSTHKEALIVAAAMVATSVSISARVLSDLHVLKSRPAKIILSAAVFDDVLGMLLLAVIVEMVGSSGVHWWRLSVLVGEAIGFALFMIFVAPRLVRRAHSALRNLFAGRAPLVISLTLCLGFSVATTWIGLAAVVGAFFAGLSLAELAGEWNIRQPVRDINEFLSPFFFFVMGAKLDLRLFADVHILRVAGVVALLAILAKMLGCGLPLIREGWRTALQVGVGMIPRGEVTLVIALIGIKMNLVSPVFYAILLFVIAATTLVAPPLLRVLFRERAEAKN